LSGDSHSLTEGWRIMVERNQGESGIWQEAIDKNAGRIAGVEDYNRLSVIQPVTHETTPWPVLLFGFLSVSIWYNVVNQFMIQRVLGARDIYHARMGIVLAGYMKILMPVIVVVPGLILFALDPEIMLLPWEQIRPQADKGYIALVQTMIPVGLRGLFLAALFGAIQSTVNSVINSTATIFTLDLYQPWFRPSASERHYVWVGVASSTIIMTAAIVLALYIEELGGGLFVYIQTLYAFFAPPFAAIFLLGILFKRINNRGAVASVFLGFAFGIALKLYVQFFPSHPAWVEPYSIQALLNWLFCVAVATAVTLATSPPPPHKVTDQLTFNWRKVNIGTGLGDHWYSSVVTWWLLFVIIVAGLVILLSGRFV
ncbi:MAG: sodium:solute symporter family transporter, partial [Acidobacteriota bacterium]